MCKAIARIHSKQICHRDLKPGNFLIFSRFDIRLGDFGTAKFLDGSMPDMIDKYEMPVGDIFYSAPEHICQIGISDTLAFLADIFSLGAILFEMFSRSVLSNQLYSKDFVTNLLRLNTLLSHLPQKDRIKCFLETIDIIAQSVNLPDIFSYNDFTPKSIRDHLNAFYKALTQINFARRLNNFQSIYRNIEICLLTLRNEEKYQKWLRRKKELRSIRV